MPSRRKKSTLNIDSRLKSSVRNTKRSNAKSKPSRSLAHNNNSVHNSSSVYSSMRKRDDSLAANGLSTTTANSLKKQQKAEKKKERNALKQQQKQAKEDKKRAKNEAKLEKLKATKEKKSLHKRGQSNVYVMPASQDDLSTSVSQDAYAGEFQNKQLEYQDDQNQIRQNQIDEFNEDVQNQNIFSQTNPATIEETLKEEMQRSKRRSKNKRRARAEQRAKRQQNAYVVYVLRILAIVAVVVVLIFAAIFVYRSNIFRIDNVEVSGAYHLNNLEVTRIAAISDDSTLLRLDEKGIKQRLSENAWVQDVELKREFPNTLKIIITERSAAAAVRINDKSIWVVSADGAWLSSATNDDWNNNPRIVDVSTSITSPVSGKACDDEGILNALNVVKVLSQRTKDELDTISAESAAKMTLNLKSGVSVAFGEAQDVELKEAAIWSILDKLQGKVSYINVHVPSRPTYRSISNE